MSKFEITSDTPRLVVLYRIGEDGNEQFQWGVVGSIPLLSLIGAIVRAQNELQFREPLCDEPAFVIVWDNEKRIAYWKVNKDIPIEPLLGMLETIKATLVASRIGQQQAAQQTQILGPNGTPMRRM
jgi:hypothetical protein